MDPMTMYALIGGAILLLVFFLFPDFGDESPSITTFLCQQKYGALSAPSAPERISTNKAHRTCFQLVI